MCVVVIATLWTKAISRHPPWRARWLPPHYAVLLCFFGQLLIQEPVLAAQRLLSGWCGPHYIGLENDIHSGARQVHIICVSWDECTQRSCLLPLSQSPGGLPWGLTILTFATLVLIGTCAPGDEGVSAQSYGFKALVSCWPLIKFSSSSAVISSYRRKLEHFLMAGCIVAVLFMLLRTRASLRHASYMTHRHRQLFFHLLVIPVFVQMAVINIVASFISLYVSTLLLVLFIAYAYLPPR